MRFTRPALAAVSVLTTAALASCSVSSGSSGDDTSGGDEPAPTKVVLATHDSWAMPEPLIRAFEEDSVPVDAYGVGSSLIRGSNDFTADVVMCNGRACGKVGREFRPNPRLSRVS